jgi:hypothetical protein
MIRSAPEKLYIRDDDEEEGGKRSPPQRGGRGVMLSPLIALH